MTIQTSAAASGAIALTNSIRTKYINKYVEAAMFERVYDQLSHGIDKDGVEEAAFLGSSIQYDFLSDMEPGTTAISQTTDITPQALRATTATVTPVSRGEALQWSQQIDLMAYTNYGEQRFRAIGKNMMESLEILAAAAALQGGNVLRAAARASLDAGNTAHNLTEAAFGEAEVLCQTLKVPALVDPSTGRKSWIAVMHPSVFYDLRNNGNVESVALYQKSEIVLNYELGRLGPFKIIVSPWAKVFGAAGADHASNVDTTLSSAVNALSKTFVVASATNITSGDWLTVGTEETANTFQALNERVRVSADYVSGTTIDIVGEGANGGLRFGHASGVAVRNADSVFPVAYGGTHSLAKVFDREVGEFGEVVGPLKDGILEQFKTLGWKWWGQYGRPVESFILRGEYSSSLEA